MFCLINDGSWTRIISVVDDQGTVIRFPAWATGFSVLQTSRSAQWPTQPSTEWMLGALTQRWNDVSSSAEVKNECNCTSTPPCAFMACTGTSPLPYYPRVHCCRRTCSVHLPSHCIFSALLIFSLPPR